MREKRLTRFSTPDFKNKFRAVRNLQRARSAKFPAQDFFASPMREKRLARFSTPDFKNKFRAVRHLQRARSAKFPAQGFFASPMREKRLGRFSTPCLKSKSWKLEIFSKKRYTVIIGSETVRKRRFSDVLCIRFLN